MKPNITPVEVIVYKPTDPFWMVFCEGGSAPTVKYKTYAIARAEAERIALNTGRRAFVLMPVDTCGQGSLVWSPMERGEKE